MPRAHITGPDMGAVLGRLGSAITAGTYKTVNEAALAAKLIHIKVYKQDIGADMRMSGVGKKGAKIGVNYTIKPGDVPVARMGVRGPAHLIERNTASHLIYPRKGVRGARNRRRKSVGPVAIGYSKSAGVLKGPAGFGRGVGYSRFALHPGTRGKHTFQRGLDKAQPKINMIIRKRTFNIVKSAAGV